MLNISGLELVLEHEIAIDSVGLWQKEFVVDSAQELVKELVDELPHELVNELFKGSGNDLV